MTIYDSVLLDTNVLIYAEDILSEYHQTAKKIRDKSLKGEVFACICPQILSEYYSIVTNSKRVVHPIHPKQALLEIEKYISAEIILKIYPNMNTLEELSKLIEKYKPTGTLIFDVTLIATMLSNK
jgi:predicted nucleic acid-binding protein